MPERTDIQLDALVEKARREVIALERENNADNNLMSFGDVRNILTDVRDDAIEMSEQLLGIVLMRVDAELREKTERIVDEAVFVKAARLQKIAQWLMALLGFAIGFMVAKIVL